MDATGVQLLRSVEASSENATPDHDDRFKEMPAVAGTGSILRLHGSLMVRNCRAATFVNSCTTPEGHSIRKTSTFVASPKPNWARKSFWLAKPPPPVISRICHVD